MVVTYYIISLSAQVFDQVETKYMLLDLSKQLILAQTGVQMLKTLTNLD